jgi:CBS domain-containing membrane protein
MTVARTRASDILDPNPWTLRPDAPALESLQAMLRRGINAAPVTDGAGRLVGILSELDGIRMASQVWSNVISAPRVDAVMVSVVHTAKPSTPVFPLAGLIEKHRIQQVPVVDARGVLLGVVRRAAVLRAILEDLRMERPERPRGLYLSAVGRGEPARLASAREG